jgi:hypothetical protein
VEKIELAKILVRCFNSLEKTIISREGTIMFSLKRSLGILLILSSIFLIQCGGNTGGIDDSVKQELISRLEQSADGILADCDETLAAWAELLGNPIYQYQFFAMKPFLNQLDIDRLDQAEATLLPKIQECFPESVFNASVSSAVDDSLRHQCEESCPISAADCAYWYAACIGGDNQACCWAGACGSKSHCVLVCYDSNGCNVPPGPPPPPNGDA